MIKFVMVLMGLLVLAIVALGWALSVIDEEERQLGVYNKRLKQLERMISDED